MAYGQNIENSWVRRRKESPADGRGSPTTTNTSLAFWRELIGAFRKFIYAYKLFRLWWLLEQQGYKSLANTSDYDDIYAPTVYLYKKSLAAADPKLPELLIKVHAEAIKRFYEDKAFAVKAYLANNKNDDPADIARVYDHYARTNTYERVPYLDAAAVRYMIDHPVDAQSGAQLKKFDFRMVIDNAPVDRLVKEGFFEKLYGSGIKGAEDRQAKSSFR